MSPTAAGALELRSISPGTRGTQSPRRGGFKKKLPTFKTGQSVPWKKPRALQRAARESAGSRASARPARPLHPCKVKQSSLDSEAPTARELEVMGLPRTVGLRAELCRGLRMRVCSAVCGEECTGACRQEALKTCPVCGRATQRKPFWESGEKENPLCRRAKCKNLWKSLKHLERAVQESARKALVAAVERGEAV